MDSDSQLEFFDVPATTAPRSNRMVGMGRVVLRYDHAVLCGMVALIGVAVVFGLGVERGKMIARADHLMLGPQFGAVSEPSIPMKPITPPPPPAPNISPPAAPKAVAGKSKFAIQVVTYSKTTLARQELTRLLGRGEEAFLIDRGDGRMVLCVGPFSTREKASVRLSRLKQRYQDCFIRTL